MKPPFLFSAHLSTIAFVNSSFPFVCLFPSFLIASKATESKPLKQEVRCTVKFPLTKYLNITWYILVVLVWSSLPPSLPLSLLLYFHLLALLLYFYLLIILLYFYLLLLLLFLLSLFCCFHSISRWHVVGRSGARYSTNFYFYYN